MNAAKDSGVGRDARENQMTEPATSQTAAKIPAILQILCTGTDIAQKAAACSGNFCCLGGTQAGSEGESESKLPGSDGVAVLADQIVAVVDPDGADRRVHARAEARADAGLGP